MAGWSSSNTYSQVGPISLHADHQTDTTVSLISGTARPTVHYRPTTPVSRPLETWVPLVNREQRNAPYVRQRARLSCGERVVSQQNPAVWGGVCRNSTPLLSGGRAPDGRAQNPTLRLPGQNDVRALPESDPDRGSGISSSSGERSRSPPPSSDLMFPLPFLFPFCFHLLLALARSLIPWLCGRHERERTRRPFHPR
jgi:hypothetical protein